MLDNCAEDMEFFEKFTEKGLVERLRNVADQVRGALSLSAPIHREAPIQYKRITFLRVYERRRRSAHHVCRQLPSAFPVWKKGGLWTYESEVSSPSYQTYPRL